LPFVIDIGRNPRKSLSGIKELHYLILDARPCYVAIIVQITLDYQTIVPFSSHESISYIDMKVLTSIENLM
jgi:hypothetical protein